MACSCPVDVRTLVMLKVLKMIVTHTLYVRACIYFRGEERWGIGRGWWVSLVTCLFDVRNLLHGLSRP